MNAKIPEIPITICPRDVFLSIPTNVQLQGPLCFTERSVTNPGSERVREREREIDLFLTWLRLYWGSGGGRKLLRARTKRLFSS